MPFFDNVLSVCYGKKRKRKEGEKESRWEGGKEKERVGERKNSYYLMFLLLHSPRIERNYSTQQFCLIVFS